MKYDIFEVSSTPDIVLNIYLYVGRKIAFVDTT